MPSLFETPLTESQIQAMSRAIHIYTADDSATETTRRDTWVMFRDSYYVATVYSLDIRNAMITDGRANRAIASYTYRHPQSEAHHE
jgi:hypothetical protein